MVCTFIYEVKRKEICQVDLWGKIPELYMRQSSAESFGIKIYPALLICLSSMIF
jgi:hypothetical protein